MYLYYKIISLTNEFFFRTAKQLLIYIKKGEKRYLRKLGNNNEVMIKVDGHLEEAIHRKVLNPLLFSFKEKRKHQTVHKI